MPGPNSGETPTPDQAETPPVTTKAKATDESGETIEIKWKPLETPEKEKPPKYEWSDPIGKEEAKKLKNLPEKP